MSENKTRKAVVTTAQVQAALVQYAALRTAIGHDDTSGHEFDKGFRGKGFAEYDVNGQVVRTFETKDEALNLYRVWVDVATEVLEKVAPKTLDKAVKALAEASEQGEQAAQSDAKE